jgi:hypothetical protein
MMLLMTSTAGELAGQGSPGGGLNVDTIAPRPADVETVDGIIKAFYEVISGPAGQPREWARDRTLYVPGVRFVSLGVRNGVPVANVMTHDEYVARTDPGLVANGFFEVEVDRQSDAFGNMMHVWSTYEYRDSPHGDVLGRGINSIQLYHDGSRWWITAVIWDNERPDNPLRPR